VTCSSYFLLSGSRLGFSRGGATLVCPQNCCTEQRLDEVPQLLIFIWRIFLGIHCHHANDQKHRTDESNCQQEDGYSSKAACPASDTLGSLLLNFCKC